MLNSVFLFVSVFSLNLLPNQAVVPPSPKILKGQGVIVLPEKMKGALNKFNSNFAVWRVEDYAPTIANADQYRDDARVAPFAVIVDVNKDGVLDVILDGHDNQKALLIGVISNREGYSVV